ncbi:hypothetical protein GDO81_024846 [Engystomops pustulosus]|uniref:P-type domain-containing protein n=1 Tax=Engystomops pustulosus TaxID=76066 RepID=A0AAV6Z2G4_ENGPU|nr:hypothetical protein GDO81_024846 [Engystomops pustulosus]
MFLQMLVVLSLPIISRAALSEAQCNVPPEKRTDCGRPEISSDECVKRGCCFDPSIYEVIWCFQPLETATTAATSAQSTTLAQSNVTVTTQNATSAQAENGTQSTGNPMDIELAAEPMATETTSNSTEKTTPASGCGPLWSWSHPGSICLMSLILTVIVTFSKI